MAGFVRIASRAELPASGEVREFTIGDKVLCVANVAGTICVMDNVCLHRGGQLGQGSVERGKVVCPWHGWEWDPVTGAAVQNPAVKIEVYPVKIERGDVLVEI